MATFMTYTIPAHTKGDTWNGLEIQLNVNGVAMDLTGALIRMHLRRSFLQNASLILEFSTVNTRIEIINALGGSFRIKPIVVDLVPFIYVYDIEITSGAVVKTYIKGTWEITAEITR